MVMTALIGHLIGKYVSCVSNWTVRVLLRFEVGGTNIAIAGTKDGGRAAILACSAQWG